MRLCLFALCVLSLFACQNSNAKQELESTLPPIQEKVAKDSIPTVQIELDRLMGKFEPANDPDFVEIEAKYADRTGRYLHKETYEAFLKMYNAAKAQGIELTIVSATRNFAAQKSIWEAKWNGQRKVSGMDLSKEIPNPKERALKILEYSSMPGTSRHHWGTDIDLNDLENSYFESGEGLKVYNWLVENAPGFGFCQTYSPKDEHRPNGYNEEKWHWSYLPIAQPYTLKAQKSLKNEMIQGFDGAESAPLIDVVNNYILGINQACMK